MLLGIIFLSLFRDVRIPLMRLSPLWRPYRNTRSADTTGRPGSIALNTTCRDNNNSGDGDMRAEGVGALFTLLGSAGATDPL